MKDAAVIVDAAELDKQLNHEPNFFTGWNGAATMGATLVTATQDQYAVSGSIGLVRVVPTVSVAGFAEPDLGGLQRVVREDYAAGLHEWRGVHAGERDQIVYFAL